MENLKVEIYIDEANSTDPINEENFLKGVKDTQETFLKLLKSGVMPRKGESIGSAFFEEYYLIITDICYRNGGAEISVYCKMQ